MSSHHLIFNPGSVVRFGGNNFIDVPIILQVGDTPLVETVREEALTKTTSFSIFNSDGVSLAKVVGPRIFLTADGRKSDLNLRHPDKMTVCEMGGKPLFEIRREAAAALAITAELFAPGGVFVKATNAIPFGSFSKDGTQIGGATFIDNTLQGCRIGYWLRSDGGLGFGCA